jgi:N-methylhydantoinase A
VRTADLRYGGQSWEVEVDLPRWPLDAEALAALRARFEDEHERLYGVRGMPGSPVEIRALRLAGLGPAPSVETFAVDHGRGVPEVRAHRNGTAVATRRALGANPTAGPLLVDEYDTTVVVPAGWRVRRDARTQALILERGDRA